jgi:hypothetical protein
MALAWIALLRDAHPSLRHVILAAVLGHDVQVAPWFDARGLAPCQLDAWAVRLLVRSSRLGLAVGEVHAVRGLEGAARLCERYLGRLQPRGPRPPGWWTSLGPSRRTVWQWRRCLESPLLCDVVSHPSWPGIPPEVAEAILEAFYFADSRLEAQLRAQVDELLGVVARTAPRRGLRLVEEFAQLATAGRKPARLLPWAVRLAVLASGASASRSARTGRALAALMDAALQAGQPELVFGLPAGTLRLLDEAAVIPGRALLLSDGLAVLGELWPALVRDALMETARVVGSAHRAFARQLLAGTTPGLAGVRAAMLEGMGRGLPLDLRRPADRHAVQMLAGLHRSRRGLRRFLSRGCPARPAHPANAAWLRRHPRLDVAAWMHGLVREVDVRGHGTVRLAVEREPLEALRLGTHTGTCLGLGGSWLDAAAAFVLDVNLQVVFARREDGHVLGRQALAVTDTDELAVGTVYPGNAPAEVTWAFLSYDLELSDRLGLPLAARDHELRPIVSREYYDDGVWSVVAD